MNTMALGKQREQVRVTVLEMTIVGDAAGAAMATHIYTRLTPRPLLSVSSLAPRNHEP